MSHAGLALDLQHRQRDPGVDADWQDIAALWKPRSDTTYLNHGSFGLSSLPVREYRQQLLDQLDQQPMDFYVRRYESFWSDSIEALAGLVGTSRDNLVMVENATYGMNVIAASFHLQPGDEVLLNNHEYGSVKRIWERQAERCGAGCVSVDLPEPLQSAEQVIQALLQGVTGNTRLLIISHITSPTGIILPVQEVCQAFRERGIAVAIDGPHAPAQVDLRLDELGCDFYTASCHKWLGAPLGTGFCFAHPDWHDHMRPPLKSWGRLLPALPQTWSDEFIWSGTRDPTPYFSIPAAIELMQSIGLENFRRRAYWLAGYARQQLCELTGQTPLAPDSWYGCMAHVPLPSGDHSRLQEQLWARNGIEVPIIDFEGRWFVRTSSHLYNHRDQYDTLVRALHELIRTS